MVIHRRRTGPAALTGLAAFTIASLLQVHPLALVIGFALAAWIPGLAVLRLLRVETPDKPSELGIAAALSIPLSAALTCALALVGVPLGAAIAAVVIVSVAIVFMTPPPRDSATERWPWVFGVVLVLAAALVLVMVRNPYVRNWSDSWFHVAVFNEVVTRGVPPGFPHAAGLSLPYPWLFHVWLAALSHWLTPDPTVLMAALNVFTALTLPMIVYALARAAGARPAEAAAAAVVFLIGINPLGALLPVLRAIIGHTTGWAVLRDEIGDSNQVMGSMSLGYHFFDAALWARLGTATAFNFALVVAGGVVWFAAQCWQRPSGSLWVAFALAIGGLFMWHTLTAYAIVITLVGACALGVLVRLIARERWRQVLLPALLIALGIAVGYALAFPYLRIVTQGAGSGQLMRLALSRENLVALVIAGGAIVLLALLGLRRWPEDDYSRAWWAGALIALGASFLLFDLPGSAEEKLFYPLVLLCAALAGRPIVALWERRGLARAAIVVFALMGVLTTALTVFAFAHDTRSLRSLFDGAPVPDVALFTPDEASAMQWVREQSPPRAVFLQAPRPFSNEPILVFGARRLYLGPAEFFYRAIFFPSGDRPPVPEATWKELGARRELQDKVFAEAPLDSAAIAQITGFPDPVYIWADQRLGRGRLSPTVTADTAHFHPVVETSQVTVFAVTK